MTQIIKSKIQIKIRKDVFIQILIEKNKLIALTNFHILMKQRKKVSIFIKTTSKSRAEYRYPIFINRQLVFYVRLIYHIERLHIGQNVESKINKNIFTPFAGAVLF